jgi:outer membrane protein TolC
MSTPSKSSGPKRAVRRTWLGLAALLAFGGCASPRQHVATRVASLAKEWQTNILYQTRLPDRALDWPTALAELRAHNLKLRQAGTDRTNAQEAVHQVFRDLLPMLDLHAGVAKQLVDFPSIGPNDVTFSADSFFNIPGLVNFSARLYVTRLALLRAEAAYELTEREQIIDLYKLFWSAQELQAEARQLQEQKKTARAFGVVDPFTGQTMLTQTEVHELSQNQEVQTFQQHAGDLLGSQQYHWIFLTNGLPILHYDVDPLPLTDTNRVAQLQLRLAAIELEAARAELSGIKLRYWPELDIFVTGPPLYQSTFGQAQFWSADQLRASADVFWTIDTRGYITTQLRQTKRQQAIQQERLRQESLTLMQKLITSQRLLQATYEQERDLEQELQVLEAVPPAQNFDSLQKYATDYETTSEQLRRVRRELAELNTLFWFVDEAAWIHVSPLKNLTASR